jgi:ATP-binding cassette subfamily F protein uup
MEQRELEALPQKIDALEKEQQQLFADLSDPQFYKKEQNEAALLKQRFQAVEAEIACALQRWEQLESIAQGT